MDFKVCFVNKKLLLFCAKTNTGDLLNQWLEPNSHIDIPTTNIDSKSVFLVHIQNRFRVPKKESV